MRKETSGRKAVEVLEKRLLLSASHGHHHSLFQHVLIISVDGLHQADVTDPALAADMPNILALKNGGISYAHASTTRPSDSFPGTLAYLTGAGPGTTGVYYDDSYSRTLIAPGGTTATPPGTEVQYAENIDKNLNLISGGGNFDASSIDPTQLPLDSQGRVVYPHQFLKVNTIFNVAHDAGLYTAFMDKHPAYEIANGPSGNGLNDFYAPEVNSFTALLDPATNKTISADSLLATPFVDISKYKLVDASTDPLGPSDPNLEDTTHNFLLTEKNDDLKVQGILNEINGMNSRGTESAPVPNLFGFNFQGVSVAEKSYLGGINVLPDGSTVPSDILKSAIAHTDNSIGEIVSALKANHIWSSTLIALTAKHGQAPRVGSAGIMADSTLPGVLNAAGTPVAFAVQDDVSLLYLKDQSQTDAAVATLQNFKDTQSIDVYFEGTLKSLPANQIIDQILSGPALKQYDLGNPAKDSTTPDIIVTLKPGFIWVGNPKKFQYKRAEHGGFSEPDTHVPLILSSGNIPSPFSGEVIKQAVTTRQIAVTALLALGLDPSKLQGAVAEHTQALPIFAPHRGGDLGELLGSDDLGDAIEKLLKHFRG